MSGALPRMNRIASIVILPMMVLAIVVFGRFADDGGSTAEPPSAGTIVVANLRDETVTFFALATGETRVTRLPGPPHELVEAEGRIYVTLGRADGLVELDATSGAILRLLPLEGEPHGLALMGGNLVVTLDRADAVVVLDRATLTELRRYPTGETPHAVAVSGSALLVTDSRANALRQLEPGTRTAPTGGQPESVALAGRYAVTADYLSGTATITLAADLAGASTVQVGSGPVRVAAFDERTALVALQGNGAVAVVDVEQARVVRRVETAARPDGICVSPDRAYFAVASNGAGVVEVFSTADWKRVTSVSAGAGLGACLWLP